MKKYFLIITALCRVQGLYVMENKEFSNLNKEIIINAEALIKELPKNLAGASFQQKTLKEKIRDKINDRSELVCMKHDEISAFIDDLDDLVVQETLLNKVDETAQSNPLLKKLPKWIPTKPCLALGLSATHIFVTAGCGIVTSLVTFASMYLTSYLGSIGRQCQCNVTSIS